MNFKKFISLSILAILFYACGNETTNKNVSQQNTETKKPKLTPMIDFSVVKKYPHDKTVFTEGFLFHNNQLFESSGAPDYLPQTRSVFGIVDLEKGKLNIKGELDKNTYFGEGIVIVNNRLYQLTYLNQTGFVYDATTFQRIGQFSYQNKQGWGMTTEGKHLIMSDGTNILTWLNPNDYSIVRELSVTENGYALDYLNELELIDGYIYANVWLKNTIVKIDTSNGEVVGKLDLTSLVNEAKRNNPESLELNGIAYDSISKRVLVTGKLWSDIYEITFDY
ncbi:MAG: glutaminyl-peptide cyclotransferase [Bacteroidetes bacterium]|nr:glutaminyl-peptide cyclotransferase [Bacteroidota bacterium]